jgi:hypothetical protein
MNEELAGLYVSIQADLSGLLEGLSQTQTLLETLAGEGGLLGALVVQTPAQAAQIVAGVGAALAPLPNLLQTGLKAPIEAVLAGLQALISARLNALMEQIMAGARELHAMAVSLGVTSPITLEGRAEGGPVGAGELYLVGERGPELFVPTTSGQIVPNDLLIGGASGGALNINGGTFILQGVQDPESLYDALQRVAAYRA